MTVKSNPSGLTVPVNKKMLAHDVKCTFFGYKTLFYGIKLSNLWFV